MRPHKPTIKSMATGIARARMLMKAKLRWMVGYPRARRGARGEIEWVTTPYRGGIESRVIEIDRSLLRSATYSATKLHRRFPRALPKLVGDADAWRDAVAFQLDQLKAHVHCGQALRRTLFDTPGRYAKPTRRRVAKLIERSPALRRVLDAASWMLCTRIGEENAYLRFFERHADALRRVLAHTPDDGSVTLVLQLAHLATTVGPKRAAPLLELLADDRLRRTPLSVDHTFVSQLQQAISTNDDKRSAVPVSPSTTAAGERLAEELRRLIAWLLTVDATVQRHALRLLDLGAIDGIIDAWARWWPPIERLLDKARGLHLSRESERKRFLKFAELRSELDVRTSRIPAKIDAGVFVAAVRVLAGATDDAVPRSAAGALRRLARVGQPELPAQMLIHWSLLLKEAGVDDELAAPRVPALIRGFADYLRRIDDDPAGLSPWAPVQHTAQHRAVYQYTLDDDLLDNETTGAADIPLAFDALAIAHRDGGRPLSPSAAQRLGDLVHVTRNAALSARLVRQLLRSELADTWHSTDTYRLALRLSRPSHDRFADTLAAIEKLNDGTASLTRALALMGDVFVHHLNLLRALLLGPDVARTVDVARRLVMLRQLKRLPDLPTVAPPDDRPRPWIDDYPAGVRDALRLLAACDPDAPDAAHRATRRLLRDRRSLLEERNALRRRITDDTPADSPLRRRLDNLTRRIAEPDDLTDAQTRKLSDKIELAAARSVIDRIDRDATDTLLPTLCERLKLDTAPDWLLRHDALDLIHAILDLEDAHRERGLALLRRRAAPPPWDLRDHPDNRAYLDRLADRDIDATPWVDGVEPVTVSDNETGDTLTLALEDDPIQVMSMGTPFQTCLSVGQFNFFSAVSNAADINKRVIFARHDDGRLAGRCLLALTDEGHMLVFRVYAHQAYHTLTVAMQEFAETLAERMSTTIVPRGHVPCLVSTDWYDDGPVNITGQLDQLQDGSAMTDALRDAELADVPGIIEQHLQPMNVNAMTLPMLLNLAVFGERPELAIPLLPATRGMIMPDHTWALLANLLEKAGSPELVAEFCLDPLERCLRHDHRRHGWMPCDPLRLLARHRPSAALRLLRETRSRRVRHWKDEQDPDRILAAGTAFEQLNRPAQALQQFRRLARRKDSRHHRPAAREAIARIKRGRR